MSASKNPYGTYADAVRQYDPDRFLLTMLMPQKYHADLLALFAFNHEIAKTREVVTETRLGLIRLQWWREALAEIYEGKTPRKHDVVEALASAVKFHDLLQESFETLLYAREFDLEDVLPESLEGLVNYADFTTTPLFKLALKVMGQDLDDALIQPVAVNYALVNLMRAVPFHAAQRRCFIPSKVLGETGQSVNKLYDGRAHENLPVGIEQVLSVCDFKAQTPHSFLKKANRLAEIYYNHLKSNDFNIFVPKSQAEPAFKLIRLLLP